MKLKARGVLRGMTVIKPLDGDEIEWTVLERSPRLGHWWLHRYDQGGNWITCEARYSELVQVIE